jgi:hypothetical protein
LPGAPGLTVDEGETAEDAVMASVEEMLEGFDWTATASVSGLVGGEGGRKKGSADAIESRLLDELAALDSVSRHGVGFSSSAFSNRSEEDEQRATNHEFADDFRQTYMRSSNRMIVLLRSWDISTRRC